MSRWIIVSNRLPFKYNENNGKIMQSSGGLVTALKGIKTKNPMHWVGSLDDNIPNDLIKNFQSKNNTSFSYPNISKELYESFYNGFSNDVLWPLFHYETEIVRFNKEHWDNYKKVNMIFAKHIAKLAKNDDLIWIHDFHLMLLPQYLKEINKNLKIGFFLHIPFPSSEVYRQLPCRKEIIHALTYSDLIGFHDYSYLRHFASSAYNVLGIKNNLLELQGPLNKVKLGVYPVSIDTNDFIKNSQSKKTLNQIKKHGFSKRKRKTILGVDRLDYTKGILLKLQTFKRLLENNPSLVGNVELYQIAVPSRTEVIEYINLRHEVERLVSEINGKFSKINYVPVKYIYKSIELSELLSLYRSSQVLFVASKRDGMNLVCLEYIAAQSKLNPGIVLLSEFTGAASTLSHATIINPYDIENTAIKLKQALSADLTKRKNDHGIMLEYLKNYTATTWAKSFMDHLQMRKDIQVINKINLESQTNLKKLRTKIEKKHLTLLLDYDGTLSPIMDRPELAIIRPEVKKFLKNLTNNQNIDIVIVTGRDKKFITKQLNGLDLYIACEHGATFYDYKKNKWRSLAPLKRKAWLEEAQNIMQQYQNRTPNSFIEKKSFGIAWHYRKSPQDFGEFQARKLAVDLESNLKSRPVSVTRGKKVIEIKSIEANKGYFTEWFIPRYTKSHSHIIAIGDDKTDEDMFRSLINKGTTIKVGEPNESMAQYYIEYQKDVVKVLKSIIN